MMYGSECLIMSTIQGVVKLTESGVFLAPSFIAGENRRGTIEFAVSNLSIFRLWAIRVSFLSG